MKTIIFAFTIILSFPVFANGFNFPNIDYSYARLYLFNLNAEETHNFDYSIYHKGEYATSKLGNGYELSKVNLEEMSSIYRKGMNELRYGLSKCFTPRHGIIYFDQKGTPVASVSICFECDRVYFWSKNELPEIPEWSDDFNIKKAEQQIMLLRKIIEVNKIPLMKTPAEYQVYLADKADYSQVGTETIERKTDTLFKEGISIQDVKSWVVDSENQLRESVNTEYTAGGVEYEFKELRSKKSKFLFSDNSDSAQLIEATIKDYWIALPLGVQLGMSHDQVITTLGLYDGPSNPESITIEFANGFIEYRFKNQSLIEIQLILNLIE